MTDRERDRIECAIRHIQTAVDVDPWAVEIAVEAMSEKLSREPSEDVRCSEIPNSSDCISRQAAIALVTMEKPQLLDSDALYMAIDELPSAQLEPKWIPCSERFPEEGEEVLVYLFDGKSPYLAWIQDGLWRTEDFVVDADYEPVAWMPLPAPYKGCEQDEDN